jgi:hypothetical protein
LRCQATKVVGLTTVRASRQLNQRLSSINVRRVGLSARRGYLALLIESKLLTQEQILGRERSSGAQAETQKVDYITQDP